MPWLQERVAYTGDDCVIWPFGRNHKGYGTLGRRTGFVTAHRWMCNAAHGPSPEGKPQALHSCGNGRNGCVNPRHLRWGSQQDNVDDSKRMGELVRGEQKPASVLSSDDVRVIRYRYARGGVLMRELAVEYGVSKTTIVLTIQRKKWAHVE